MLRNLLLFFILFLAAKAPASTANTLGLDSTFGSARWIGAPADCLPLYADYLPVFAIEFSADLASGGKVALVYGADDPRLMDPNLNIYHLANQPGESGIKIEIDAVGMLNVYRSGYHPSDNPSVPIASFPAKSIKKGINKVRINSNLGITDFFVNDEAVGNAVLNPVGRGGDYTAFPVVADMAVEIPKGSKNSISDLTLLNFRQPGNPIFRSNMIFTESSKIELPERSLPELKSVFKVSNKADLKQAIITCTARGIYDLYINGKRVTGDYFYPGSTQYNKTHLYHSFAILPYLQDGENEVRVSLGEGWWSGGSTFVGENWNFFGDRQSFIADISLNYADGSVESFHTDPETWLVSTDGPLKEGSFFQGEIYDASCLSLPRIWHKAVEIALDSTVNRSVGSWDDIRFLPSFGDRVVAVDTLTALSVSSPGPGIYVYDMGQNMAAVPLLTFNNLDKGQSVNIRYAEMLYPDSGHYAPEAGRLMTENLRAAMCRDIYIAAGKQQETYSPRFTLHGYRYLELSGLENPLPLEAVRSVPVSSVREFKAGFECSDSLVNRLWQNIKWSTLSNFISIPTDCPQRNERLGWMGDISVYAPTATKLADLSALLRQYLSSVRDCQSSDGKFPDVAPTGFGFGGLLWGSAGITVPWECWRQYGDIDLLREHYPSMKRYIDFILSHTIDPATGIIVQDRAWGDLADWLSPEYDKTDKSLLWECYFIYDLGLMENVARLLGFDEDADNFEKLLEERKEFFVNNYIDPSSGFTVHSRFNPDKAGQKIDTQVSYALPIAMGIYSDERFIRNFINTIERENIADNGTLCPPYSLMTGFIGTAWIQEALSKAGRSDIAYRLLTSTSYPSWLYPVTQGATTVWERLDSYTHEKGFGDNNSMNSFNHYSFGAVGNWLLTRCLGIKVLPDGTLDIAPEPDPTGSLTFAKGWLDTPAGRVSVGWRVTDDGTLIEISTPEGERSYLYDR